MEGNKGIDGIETMDTEGYKAGSEYGLKTIIYKQLQRCIDEGSKEMTGGGTVTRIIDGNAVNIAVPNQREIYINCCEHLKLLLLKHIKDNKEKIKKFMATEKFIDGLEKEERDIKKDCDTETEKVYKQFQGYSFKLQAKFENIFNINIQRINDKFEIKLIELYKLKFMRLIPHLLAETNFFGED